MGSTAFKAAETGDPRLAGSIPVHLRHTPWLGAIPVRPVPVSIPSSLVGRGVSTGSPPTEIAPDRQWMVTVPALPSTVTMAPSGMISVASATEATQGMPSSRDTIIA